MNYEYVFKKFFLMMIDIFFNNDDRLGLKEWKSIKKYKIMITYFYQKKI